MSWIFPMRVALNRWRNQLRSRRWSPHSRLFLLADEAPWVLTEEMRCVAELARGLGALVEHTGHLRGARGQSLFCAGLDLALLPIWRGQRMQLAAAHYHGTPGTGEPAFDRRHEALRSLHPSLSRLQVTNTRFREVVLDTGIDPSKVHLIPIGIELDLFTVQTAETKRLARERFGLPQSACVIGSFQKDGVGWGEGTEPKRIKGPDILLRVIEAVRAHVPGLHVFLSGPARGFVKSGLRSLGVPFTHVHAENYADLGTMYHALDLYLVTAREEGGPKALLESMASGVPIVTTRVGQATDMVRHGQNGWMVDVEDVDGLAHWALHALGQPSDLSQVLYRARLTAEENAYERQLPLWHRFFDGFVDLAGTVGRQ